MAKQGQLDDSFFTRNWVRRGREYRLLWEPVEIANYYRLNLHKESVHFIDGLSSELDDNNKRPGRFILLQKQEQRIFGSDPGYGMQSSLGLAWLLKERGGNRSWAEFMQQPDGPDGKDATASFTLMRACSLSLCIVQTCQACHTAYCIGHQLHEHMLLLSCPACRMLTGLANPDTRLRLLNCADMIEEHVGYARMPLPAGAVRVAEAIIEVCPSVLHL